MQSASTDGGQISAKFLRQALAQQNAMDEFKPSSGNEQATAHRRGPEDKVKPRKDKKTLVKKAEWERWHAKTPEQKKSKVQ